MKTRLILLMAVVMMALAGTMPASGMDPSPILPAVLDLPERAYIAGVVGHAQRFTLSCESRSAVDWANFWGVGIGEKKFLNSLPRSDNPDQGFVGDPNSAWGNVPPASYGVHAEPVAGVLRSYGLDARAYRDLSWDDLRAEVAAGRPVIVWVIGQMWSGSPQVYTSADGHATTVARFEHTMILVGYEPGKVYVVDAYTGQNQTYSFRTFMNSWRTLGRMAIFGGREVQPVPPPPPPPETLTERLYMPVIFGPDTFLTTQLEPDSQPETYTVRRGDYLTLVAKRFGLDWRKLANQNDLVYPYVIYPGQVLRLR